MFCKKGFCRYDGKKCLHLKVAYGKGYGLGYCRKKTKGKRKIFFIINEKTGRPKNFYVQKGMPISDIKAPSWCPKMEKH